MEDQKEEVGYLGLGKQAEELLIKFKEVLDDNPSLVGGVLPATASLLAALVESAMDEPLQDKKESYVFLVRGANKDGSSTLISIDYDFLSVLHYLDNVGISSFGVDDVIPVAKFEEDLPEEGATIH